MAELELLKYSLDPIAFTTDVLGLECKNFHREWLELFEKHQFVCLQAPRSHGKTSLVGAYIIWRIIRDPDIRILIVTISQDKADEMMSFIKHHLEENQKLIELFGDQRGYSGVWTRSALKVRRAGKSGFAHKEPTVTVLGITSSMVGGHYDIIVLDDITDQRNSRTEHRRRELIRWYNQTLVPMLEPEGKIITIGTRWNEKDIYDYLSRDPSFTTKRYQAIIDREKKIVLWPERYSYEKLKAIERSIGSISFELQYQNNIIMDKNSPIRGEWLQNSIENYRIPIPPYESYIGVDFASAGDDSDYFCITVILVANGCIYVVDGLRTKTSLFRQFELIQSYAGKWNPIRIGIESSAQQKIITDQLMEISTLPLVPIKTSIANDRMSRVQRLSVLFETNRIFMNPELDDWIEELKVFPRGAHDDTIDSLSFAIQISHLSEKEREINWNEVPSLIHTKVTTPTRNVNKEKYRIRKIGR